MQRRPTSLKPHYEPCEECGAPLDPQQRYCVNCAARRGNGANPSSRYFAAMSKKARRPTARPPAKAGTDSRAAAVGFFALLPIAVALGVVVGRSGSGNGENRRCWKRFVSRKSVAAAANDDEPDQNDRQRRRPKQPKGDESQQRRPKRAAARWPPRPPNGIDPPGDRLQTDQEDNRRRHQAGRRKRQADRRKLHQGAAESA